MHCVKIFYYVERGDSGERLEELISVSTVYSTVSFHWFAELLTCENMSNGRHLGFVRRA